MKIPPEAASKRSLHVLHVEDVEDDTILVRRALERAGYAPHTRCVDNAAQMRVALAVARPDIVLCDFAMPGFSAVQALGLLGELAPDVPFVVVSGNVGEDSAVALVKAGASDYVLKSDLGRLGSAVEHALREGSERRARRRAETTLRDNEARLRAIVDTVADGMLVIARDGRIESVNRASEQIFGYPSDQIRGEIATALFSPPNDDLKELLAVLERVRAGSPRREIEGVRRDGKPVALDLSVSDLEVGAQQALLVMVRDVTERKRLEEQFTQAQKMEGIGRLAGGIAHDFNNLLTVILSYTGGFDDPELPPQVREDLAQVHEAAERAANLTRQLLTFARQQRIEPRVLNLAEIVLGMDKLLRRVLGEDVELTTVAEEEQSIVEIDPGQLEQVLMNLAVNARDAMPRGGRLSIVLRNVGFDEAHRLGGPQTPAEPCAHLVVRDTGGGMNAETLARTFEPFFTTKQVGHGTGLGLATCYGIIKQFGGHIWIESKVGSGTSVHMLLPRTDAPASTIRAAREVPSPRGRGETTLVVEDNDLVRDVTVRALTASGYKVLSAGRPSQALSIAAAHPGKIHIVVTDIVMPEMRGPELAAKILETRPDTRVLFVSGHSEELVGRAPAVGPRPELLAKPFTVAALTRRVREVLDR
jgi:hypothetical protein